MKGTWALTLLAICCATPAAGEEANPLGKVIELMDSLAAKIVADGEAEAKAYHEYSEWCDSAATDKKQEITTATSKQAKLEAVVGQTTGDIEASNSKISDLAASISADDGELKAATTIREKEVADFSAEEVQLADVIDSLGRAISILEKEMAKNPAAFAQVDTSSLNGLMSSLGAVVDAASFTNADKQKLLALVQSQTSSDSDDEEFGAPAAAAYKSHSTGILDVLEDLKEKAEGQMSDLRKAETNTKYNYEMLKQSLEDQIAADTKALDNEKAAKSASEETKAGAEGDLAATKKDLADAQAALEDIGAGCMQVAADHEATVKGREEELKVIAEAKQILAGSTSGAVDQTYSLLQLQAKSRLQTRADLATTEVVTLVKKLAKGQHSAALAQLASRIDAVLRYGASAGEDPFVKVKGLISEMISTLEKEAAADATEKAYCDEQMAKTEEKKAELEEDVSKLTTKIDQAAAKSAGLKEDVQTLQAELAALSKLQAEMDKARTESHADYVAAKADLEEGLTGVRKALSVLREYYGSAAAAALLQSGDGIGAAMRQPAMPEVHEKATGAGSSIVGILEVCESDFAKNLAEEETQESDAAAEYDKTTQENELTKTLKVQDVKYKTQEFTSLDKSINELTADRESTDSELSAVLEYYAKVKERCIAKPEAYEERKKRREAEINGLKQALTILEEETALMQRSTRAQVRRHLRAM